MAQVFYQPTYSTYLNVPSVILFLMFCHHDLCNTLYFHYLDSKVRMLGKNVFQFVKCWLAYLHSFIFSYFIDADLITVETDCYITCHWCFLSCSGCIAICFITTEWTLCISR